MDVRRFRTRRFLDKITGPKGKGFHGNFGSPSGDGRKNHNGDFYAKPFPFFQEFDAVHLRHFKIQNDNIRVNPGDLVQGEFSVHCLIANHKARRIIHHMTNKITHQRGIIYYQY